MKEKERGGRSNEGRMGKGIQRKREEGEGKENNINLTFMNIKDFPTYFLY